MKPEASIVPVIGYWFKTSPIPNFSFCFWMFPRQFSYGLREKKDILGTFFLETCDSSLLTVFMFGYF
jgi:hypothetical protein